jgi:hypothetical protein
MRGNGIPPPLKRYICNKPALALAIKLGVENVTAPETRRRTSMCAPIPLAAPDVSGLTNISNFHLEKSLGVK